MIFCHKCGTQQTDDSEFCRKCGAKLILENDEKEKNILHNDVGQSSSKLVNNVDSQHDTSISDYYEYEKSMPSDTKTDELCCPECKSHDVFPISETETYSTSGSSGFGSACCGFFLFGPLGLLCGFCGRESPQIFTNTETYWICKKCGNKFKAPPKPLTPEEIYKKKRSAIIAILVVFIILFILDLICLIIGSNRRSVGENKILPFLVVLLILSIAGIVGCIAGLVYVSKKHKNEKNK